MLTRPVCHTERLKLLRFAASFLWADLAIAESERTFLLELATELEIARADAQSLLERPPSPDDVDPARVGPRLAGAVRAVALRAIAADGLVAPKEMQLFDLLDALLPPCADG